MPQNVYFISVPEAIRRMEGIVTPIQRRWLVRLLWRRSPQWVTDALKAAANGNDTLPYLDAVTILFEAAPESGSGTMKKVRNAWRTLKTLPAHQP